MPQSTYGKRYPLYCCIFLLLFITLLGINPVYRFDWMLETILTVIFIAFLIVSYKRFRLSNLSYTLITIFLTLHTIGSHYTYAEVPLGFWLQTVFGFARNHYDRIVHFSFGLLMAYPVREVFFRIANARGFWGVYLPLDVTLSLSAVYEIIEWLTVVVVNPTAGAAFLGTQGDEFDPIKDMALAGIGAAIAMMVTCAINLLYKPGYRQEWKKSIAVKNTSPLGEVAISKWTKKD